MTATQIARAARDADWRDALRPPGWDAEAWVHVGPRTPEEAAVFVEEAERIGEEYRVAMERNRDEALVHLRNAAVCIDIAEMRADVAWALTFLAPAKVAT